MEPHSRRDSLRIYGAPPKFTGLYRTSQDCDNIIRQIGQLANSQVSLNAYSNRTNETSGDGSTKYLWVCVWVLPRVGIVLHHLIAIGPGAR